MALEKEGKADWLNILVNNIACNLTDSQPSKKEAYGNQ